MDVKQEEGSDFVVNFLYLKKMWCKFSNVCVAENFIKKQKLLEPEFILRLILPGKIYGRFSVQSLWWMRLVVFCPQAMNQ